MARGREKIVMSSILPKGMAKKVRRFLERHLSLRMMDILYEFWIQTRILFSRTLIMMLGALFLFFTWATIAKETFRHDQAMEFITFQTLAIALLLHMGLWEGERDGRTFEMLLMRVPGTHRLIWYKLRISLIWAALLLLPFLGGFCWFVSIPFKRFIIITIFAFSNLLFASLLTCVVASFVHRSIPTAMIVIVLLWIIFGISMQFGWRNLNFSDYFMIFMNPLREKFNDISSRRYITILLVNRAFTLSMAGLLYSWFVRRISKTEKWII